MRFQKDAEVYSREGEKVGTLEKVVLDPETNEVTHLVVEKGFLFSEAKVFPVDLVDIEAKVRLALKETKEELKEYPRFEETHYVDPGPVERRRDLQFIYWYPPMIPWWQTNYSLHPIPEYVAKTEQHIPEGTVALAEGAEVISRDGEQVGVIERIITDQESNRATHFVISEGILLEQDNLIPTTWVKEVQEDQVHLKIKASVFENLPAFYEVD